VSAELFHVTTSVIPRHTQMGTPVLFPAESSAEHFPGVKDGIEQVLKQLDPSDGERQALEGDCDGSYRKVRPRTNGHDCFADPSWLRSLKGPRRQSYQYVSRWPECVSPFRERR
jgi:hypothetical protein